MERDSKLVSSLEESYRLHLGCFLAISPEMYGQALDAIAKDLGRENNRKFREEVKTYEKTLPHYLD